MEWNAKDCQLQDYWGSTSLIVATGSKAAAHHCKKGYTMTTTANFKTIEGVHH
jgi:hypothetical protein